MSTPKQTKVDPFYISTAVREVMVEVLNLDPVDLALVSDHVSPRTALHDLLQRAVTRMGAR